MRISNRVKPISNLKAISAKILDTLALLEILAMGTSQAADGRIVEVTSAFAQVRVGLQSTDGV